MYHICVCNRTTMSHAQQWLFLNRKVKELYNQRKRPAKLAWTTAYRKMHRKVCVATRMPLVFHTHTHTTLCL